LDANHTMPATGDLGRIAERYRTFAIEEVRGLSEIYETLAIGIAESPEILDFLVTMPTDRRQPNLFLAAVRHVCGVPDDATHLRSLLPRYRERIRSVMLSRTTQTNEPARCSVLLPVLARLPQPLALLEVGASAGLCLLPDRYGYDYGLTRIEPAVAGAPIFQCATSGPFPVPESVPRIVWRVGLDVNPLDLSSDAQVEWLMTLVWPGQEDRAEKLRGAIDVARVDAPRVIKGNLLTDLEPLIATAPKSATLVVFHSAVLAYVASRRCRDRFAEIMRRSNVVWISNEAPAVFSSLGRLVPPAPTRGRFLMMVDGTPVAWTGPHGQSIDWFGASGQNPNRSHVDLRAVGSDACPR
jgi:hypothetical protein